MRAPSDMPRRAPRTSGRGRTVLVVAAIGLFIFVTSLRGIAGFYTDYLWFDSVGQTEVWRGVLGARFALAAIFTGAFFLLLWINLLIADRLAPAYRPRGPEEEFVERYQELVGGRTGLVRAVVAGVLALIAGVGVSSEWQSWLLFTHGGDFDVLDPQFDTDVGFYVFKLPFLSFLVGWLFAALLIVFVVTSVAHYLNGGIRMASARERVTPQVKAHLSVLLALLALVKAAGYWFQRYELTVSTRGVVDGATYTDVNAQLPAIYLLMLISLCSVVLFIVNIWRRGWVLPALGVGLWALVAVVAGGIYPEFVQRFQVRPNESAREALYIDRNIEATRAAYGMDDVEVVPFEPTGASDVDLTDNLSTVRNIRLWDPSAAIAGKTFQGLQAIRDYYRLNDIDVDRYDLDGEPTQVLVSARELDTSRVPQQSWEGRQLAYTHGYGVVMSTASGTAGGNRQPEFVIKDVPVANQTSLPDFEPRIYFGEGLGGYIIVDTEREEIAFEGAEDTEFTSYDGEDGIDIGSFFRRLAFGLRFADYNAVISGFLTDESRLIMMRDVRDRAEALAPFLHFDHDPYPVVLGDEVKWVLDAYTTTNRYPYSQGAVTNDLSPDSGLNHGFNYVRNSVKAVVDAYDGTVTFYVIDDEPIIEAYRDAFPDLFTDGDEMPEELREHLRYPEDMFRVQSNLWAQYHLETSREFFNVSDRWQVAQDPGTAGAAASTTTTDDQGATSPARAARIAPYYQLLQLPGEDEAEFVAMRPYSPFSENDERPQLTAFIVGRSDGDDYGHLRVYEMPSSQLPDGPGIVAASIQSDSEVSELETLLGGEGSEARYGNLLLVPIDGALLYVQPFYVESESQSRQIPQLQRVIAVLGEDVVIEQTLAQALDELFDQQVDTGEVEPPTDEPDPGEEDPTSTTEPPEGTGTLEEQIAAKLEAANQLRDEADEALQEGGIEGFAEYQAKTERANELYDEVSDLVDQLLDEGEEPSGNEGSDGGNEPNEGSDGDGNEPAGNGSTTSTTTTTTEGPTPA